MATRSKSASRRGQDASNGSGMEEGIPRDIHTSSNRKSCCCNSIPPPPAYGLMLWTFLYAGFVCAVYFLLPFCLVSNKEAAGDEECGNVDSNAFFIHSTMSWATDFFLFGAVGVLSFSLFVLLREPRTTSMLSGTAMACFAVSALLQGVAKKQYGSFTWDVVSIASNSNDDTMLLPSQPYAILTMLQTTLQAIAILLVGVLIHATTWNVLLLQSSNNDKRQRNLCCNGMLGLRLATWGLFTGWMVLLAGCTLAILAQHNSDQNASILTFYFLQAGTAVFLLCRTFFWVFAALLWMRHAHYTCSVLVEGLANTAATKLMVVLQLFWGVYLLVFYILESYFGYEIDATQSDINHMVLQYAWFVTLYCVRNVILSFDKKRNASDTKRREEKANNGIVTKSYRTFVIDDEDTDGSGESQNIEETQQQQPRETMDQGSGNIVLNIDLERGDIESVDNSDPSKSHRGGIDYEQDNSGLSLRATRSFDTSVVATTENDDQYLQFSPSLTNDDDDGGYGGHSALQPFHQIIAATTSPPPPPDIVMKIPSFTQQSQEEMEAAEQQSLEVEAAMSKSHEENVGGGGNGSRRRLFGRSRSRRDSSINETVSNAPVLIADQSGQKYNAQYECTEENDIEEQGAGFRRGRSKRFGSRLNRLTSFSRNPSTKSVQFNEDLSYIDYPEEDSNWTDPSLIRQAEAAAVVDISCGAIEAKQEEPTKEYAAEQSTFETAVETGAAGTVAAAGVAAAAIGGAFAALTNWRSKKETDAEAVTNAETVAEATLAPNVASSEDKQPDEVVNLSDIDEEKKENTNKFAFFDELSSFLLPRMNDKKKLKKAPSYDELNDAPVYPTNPCVDTSQKLAESASNVSKTVVASASNVSKSVVASAATVSHKALDNVIACNENACKAPVSNGMSSSDMFPSLVKEHSDEGIPSFASSELLQEDYDSRDDGMVSSPSSCSMSEMLSMGNTTVETTVEEKKKPIVMPKTNIDWNRPSRRDDDESSAMPKDRRRDQQDPVDRYHQYSTRAITGKKPKVDVVVMDAAAAEGRDDDGNETDGDASSSKYNPFASYDYGFKERTSQKSDSGRFYYSNSNKRNSIMEDRELQSTTTALERKRSHAAPGTVQNLAQFWSSKNNVKASSNAASPYRSGNK